ncbi:MAG: hypothetical protein V1720_00920 [bacterium]
MKKIYLSFLLISLVASCCPSSNVLNDIRAFKADDKYFSAGLNYLHFVIETSDIPRVDSVFVQMVNGYEIPVSAKGCTDGVFIGESPYDAYDYKHVVKLEIKDEKIINVDYDEVNRENEGKESDEKYNEEMKESGSSPLEAYPIYENTLFEKQNMMDVDAVSGASYSLYRFRYAVMVALMKARIEAAEN